MKDKKWEEISDRLMVIERKLDSFFSERLKEISETSEEPLKPFDYDDAWKSWEEGGVTDEEYNKFFKLNKQQERDLVKYAIEKYKEYAKQRREMKDEISKDMLDNGFKLYYVNKDETEIKELFASWGLWSLVEDISDDGDGEGDNLQLTKEGLEAHRMIEELLEERKTMGIDELFAKYREMYEVDLTLLNKKKNEKVSKEV